jgi:hypothetical protein
MLTAYREGTKNLVFAEKGISAVCPGCGSPLITKCGKLIAHHFAHKSRNDECDLRYHDGMSEWHYNWQLRIKDPKPSVNIEVPIGGEYLKRADVVTSRGLIIEFQKSSLPIDERILRENHYKNMIWVIHEDIENSRTWKNHESDVNILVDNPDLDFLYEYIAGKTYPDWFVYMNRYICEGSLGFKLKKRDFIKLIMNGKIKDMNAFFHVIQSKQNERKNNHISNDIFNVIPDEFSYMPRSANNDLRWISKPGKYYLFRYYNERMKEITSMIEYEHEEKIKLAKEMLFFRDPLLLQSLFLKQHEQYEENNYIERELWQKNHENDLILRNRPIFEKRNERNYRKKENNNHYGDIHSSFKFFNDRIKGRGEKRSCIKSTELMLSGHWSY